MYFHYKDTPIHPNITIKELEEACEVAYQRGRAEERARCAQIAENYTNELVETDAAEVIAAAIRQEPKLKKG